MSGCLLGSRFARSQWRSILHWALTTKWEQWVQQEIRLIRNSCTSHRIPLLDVGEMMHGGRHDGCCVCVTQIGLFMRSKSNINIALDTALAPLCVNVRIIGEGSSSAHIDKWPFLALCWTLDISNKTRIQIKWAEIWCNYLNATLRHKTKEKFFIAALSAMRIGTRKFSSLCFLFAICVCHNYRKSLPWISIWTFNYNPWLDMKYLFLSF